MTPAPVTDSLLHDLVASSQAEGTSQFAVAAAITLDDRVLLCGRTTPDFDQEWDLPGGPALPGETLAGALDRTLVLPGAEDAEVGGVRDADVVTRKGPAAGVAAGLWW